MSSPEIDRRLAVILAADVAGYSRLMAEDEESTLATLADFREVIAGRVSEHQGRIFAMAGDSVMAEFQSAVQAVRCAAAMQRALERRNADLPDLRKMQFRIGINLGDVMVREGDLFGDGVNVAARLQALAPPTGILISAAVQEHIVGKLPFPVTPLGERRVKNIERPVRIFAIDWSAQAPVPARQRGEMAPPDKPSIAVLPFANMSGDAEQDYFADGLTEDLITGLAKFRWFFVIARNSSFAFKGRAVAAQQVARELGVRYVLEGSSRRSGERVRVTAQLVDAETGRHLWAERYDRALTDFFALQDEIVSRVVGAIEPEMLRTETLRARQKSPENLTAWDQIFRGMWHFYQVTREDHSRARGLFRAAIGTAPDLAEGHTWLARCNAGILFYGWSDSPAADATEGWHAALQATRLAETDPYAHYASGIMSVAMSRPDRAEREAQESIDLCPSFALGHLLLGMSRLFAGRAALAMEPFEQGLRLNPYDPQGFIWQQLVAFALFLKGDIEEAARRAADAAAMRPESVSGQVILACSLARLRRRNEAGQAIVAMEHAMTASPNALSELLARFVTATDQEAILNGLREAGWRG